MVVPSAFPSELDPIAGVFVRDHARAAARSAEVLIFYPEPTGFRGRARGRGRKHPTSEDGIPIVRVVVPLQDSPRLLRLLGYPRFLWLAWRAGRGVARSFRPDVIHAHDVFPGGFLAALIGRSLHLPVVLTVHTSHFEEVVRRPTTSMITRYTLRRARMLLAVSKALQEQLVRAGVPRERTAVVPNPVRISWGFEPPTGNGERADARACVIARLTSRKGVGYLLQALAELDTPSDRGIVLDIVGDGPERQRLEQLSRELGIERDVRFHGALGRDDARQVLRNSDFLVLPSLEETFGVVVVEAMAEGKPVVATRCGGPEEIVDKHVGLLVGPGSAYELKQGLETMLRCLKDYDSRTIVESARAAYSYEAVGRALHERLAGVRDRR
jgi:glycosyltransferase involved in cell wall biosynthesis